MKNEMNNLIKVLTTILLLSAITFLVACSQNSATAPEISTTNNENHESTQTTASPPATNSQTGKQSSTTQNTPQNTSQNTVSVVIAGYINHGPMQPTVNAIKEVLSKYSDKVQVQWVDLATDQGHTYFEEHELSAHLNVIINGTYEYKVNGKYVEFQWFEGRQWTKQDLDAVLADLVTK